MSDLTAIAGKLGALICLLSSKRDGEVLNAARAIVRTLKSASAISMSSVSASRKLMAAS